MHQNVAKTLTLLDNDLTALGWDLPSRLYLLEGSQEDPTARYVGEIDGHPALGIRVMYDKGFRVPPSAHGMAVSYEMWRHLTADEVISRHPEMTEKIIDSMVRAGLKPPTPEELRESITKYYQTSMLPALPGPQHMPAAMRSDARSIVAVLRDGTSFTLAHSRDLDDLEVNIHGRQEGLHYRVAGYMYMFLHGIRPDEDTHPIRAVDELTQLQEMFEAPAIEEDR